MKSESLEAHEWTAVTLWFCREGTSATRLVGNFSTSAEGKKHEVEKKIL
ncbi:hypothetical protein [Rhizobium leucaenae]|nr:hypothetical protein [Rhizobium leucaenae]